MRWENEHEAIDAIEQGAHYEELCQRLDQLTKGMPPLDDTQIDAWENDTTNQASVEFAALRAELERLYPAMARGTFTAADLRSYEGTVSQMLECFNRNYGSIKPGDAATLRGARIARTIIQNDVEYDHYLDYARGKVYHDVVKENLTGGDLTSFSQGRWEYVQQELARQAGTEAPDAGMQLGGHDEEWWRARSNGELQRIIAAVSDPKLAGQLAGMLHFNEQERTSAVQESLELDVNGLTRRQDGSAAHLGETGFVFEQMRSLQKFGLSLGNCYAFSVIYAMYTLQHGEAAARRFFLSAIDLGENFSGIGFGAERVGQMRDLFKTLYTSPEIDSALPEGAGTLTEIIREMESEPSGSARVLSTGHHSMVLVSEVDAQGAHRYWFFDPTSCDAHYANSSLAAEGLKNHLSRNVDDYAIEMVNGEMRFKTSTIDAAAIQKINGVAITGAQSGQTVEKRLAALGSPYFDAGAQLPADPVESMDWGTSPEQMDWASSSVPASPEPVDVFGLRAERGALRKLEAQRQGDAMLQGLERVMQRGGLDKQRFVPLYETYDSGTGQMGFLDTSSAEHKVTQVTVDAGDGASNARLRGALHYLHEQLDKMKNGFTLEHGRIKAIEGVSHLEGSEAMGAGFAVQTIIELMHAHERQERGDGGGEGEPGLPESLARTLEAHVWVNVASVGVDMGKDLGKFAQTLGEVLQTSGALNGQLARTGESLVQLGGKLGEALEGVATGLGVLNVGLDIAELVQADSYVQKVTAASQLTMDSIDLGLGAAGMLLGGAAGAVLGAIGVPLGGVFVGLPTLVERFAELYANYGQINHAFAVYNENYRQHGYKMEEGTMVPLEGVPISVLDLVNNKVTFGTHIFDSNYHNEGSWDLHEGFGVNGERTNRDTWATVALDDKFKGSKTVILPFAPKQYDRLAPNTIVHETSSELYDMNGRDEMNGDGSFSKIVYSPRRGGAGNYAVWDSGYDNTHTKVLLGKDDVTLVMPSMAHLQSRRDNGLPQEWNFPYAMSYILVGGGGTYTLVPSTYAKGGTVTIEGEQSTWILRGQNEYESLHVSSVDHGTVQLTPSWDERGIRQRVLTWLKSMDFKNAVMRRRNALNSDDREGHFVQIKGLEAVHEWSSERVEHQFDWQWWNDIKDSGANGLTIDCEYKGQHSSETIDLPEEIQSILSAYRLNKAPMQLQVKNPASVLLLNDGPNVVRVDIGRNVAEVVEYSVDQAWLRAHAANLFQDLQQLATDKGLPGLTVIMDPNNGGKWNEHRGYYAAGSNAIVRQNAGLLYKYTTADQVLSDNSDFVGFAKEFFSVNPGITPAEVVERERSFGYGPAFAVFDMPLPGSSLTVSGRYDGSKWTLTGSDYGKVFSYDAQALDVGHRQLIGFTADYFKHHPGATPAYLAAAALDGNFDVQDMPFREQLIKVGHYDAKTRTLVGDVGEGHRLVVGNGSSAALALDGQAELWLYEQAGSAPSTWLLQDGKGGSEIVWESDNWVRVGATRVWLEQPAGTVLQVQQQDGSVVRLDVARRSTELVGYAVDAAWIRQHAATLFQDMDQLAKEKHLRQVKVKWAAGSTPEATRAFDGYYIPGNPFILHEVANGAIFKTASASDVLTGHDVLAAFDAKYFESPRTAAELVEYAALCSASEFDVYGWPAPGGQGTVSGHYGDHRWTLTRTTPDGMILKGDEGLIDSTREKEKPAVVGFTAEYFKRNPNDGSSLAVLRDIANGGGFEVRGMPFRDQTISVGYYDAKTRTLVGDVGQGHRLVVGDGGGAALTLDGQAELWLYEASPQVPWMLHGGGSGTASTWLLQGGKGGSEIRWESANWVRIGATRVWLEQPGATVLQVRQQDGSTVRLNLAQRSTELVEYAVDASWIRQHAANLFQDLDQLAKEKHLGQLKVRWAAGSTPEPTFAFDGYYIPGNPFILHEVADGMIFKSASASDVLAGRDVLAAFGAKYFESPRTPAELVEYAARCNASEFDVYGWPVDAGQGATVSGHYGDRRWTLTRTSPSVGLIYQGDEGLIDPTLQKEAPRTVGFLAPYFAATKATLALMRGDAGGGSFEVRDMPSPHGEAMSGYYDAARRQFTGITGSGLIYGSTDSDQLALLGVNQAWLLRQQGGLPALKRLAENEKAGVLTLTGLTDVAGKPMAAWYDTAAEEVVVGRTPAGGEASYLGMADNLAWLFDAEHGQLLTTAPLRPEGPADALGAAPVARQMLAQLGKLKSARRAGSALVVETADGLTLRVDLAQPGRLSMLEWSGAGMPTQRGVKVVNAQGRAQLDAWKKLGVQQGEAIRLQQGDAKNPWYTWYNFAHPEQQMLVPQGPEVAYLGYGSGDGLFYLFDPDRQMLLGVAAEDSEADGAKHISAQRAVRVGNVVGVDGIGEADLTRLPALDGVGSYLATTKDDLTFQVYPGGKPLLLGAGPDWLAAHDGGSEQAVRELSQCYDCADALRLQPGEGDPRWFEVRPASPASGSVVDNDWVRAHASSMDVLRGALDQLARERQAAAVTVNWKTTGGSARSASYVPGSKALLAVVEDGNIVDYGADLNSGPTVGFAAKWFAHHPDFTLQSMVDYSKQWGQGGNLALYGMPGVEGGARNAVYLAAAGKLVALNPDGSFSSLTQSGGPGSAWNAAPLALGEAEAGQVRALMALSAPPAPDQPALAPAAPQRPDMALLAQAMSAFARDGAAGLAPAAAPPGGAALLAAALPPARAA